MDSGCSGHTSSGRTAVASPVDSDCIVLLQTAKGVAKLDKEVDVAIPEVKGPKTALLNPDGPDMASWGQLVYEDGWVVDHWSRDRGLLMRDENGKRVRTHMDGYVPCLGKGKDLPPPPKLSAAGQLLSPSEIEDMLTQGVDCLVTAILDATYEFDDAICKFVSESPFPVLHDENYALATNVQRHPNVLSSVDPARPVTLTLMHLLAHFPKMPGCPACESGKLVRAPSFKVVPKDSADNAGFVAPKEEPSSASSGKIEDEDSTEIDVSSVNVDNDEQRILPTAAPVPIKKEEEVIDPPIDPTELDEVQEEIAGALYESANILDAAIDDIVGYLCPGVSEAVPMEVDDPPAVPSAPKNENGNSDDTNITTLPAPMEPQEIVRRYLRRLYVDLVGPTVESIEGHTGAYIAHDEDTNWGEIGTIPDKSPDTVLAVHKEKFPGTVSSGSAPASVYCDNGGGFKGSYEEHVINAGGKFVHSLEGRPKTNARTERYHQTFGNCVKSCLKQANGPLRFWAPCARHTMVNLNRVPDGRDDGFSPFIR